MVLTDAQMAQAVAEARALVVAKSADSFINYSAMVTDDQIAQAIAQVLGAVTETPPIVSE
jgi:hypothetical protein